jgi:hypothetical protein
LQAWIGLTLSLISSVMVNWAYTREHAAAAQLPPLSPRNPVQSLRTVSQSRPWLIAFAAETAGWLLYVAAVRLAPLALVQAVNASGIAVLALLTTRGKPSRLARHEQIGVVVSLIGLLLLALSLTGKHAEGVSPDPWQTLLWLALCAGVAVVLIVTADRIPAAAGLGFAAGLLFGAGDISTKLVVNGGIWLIALIALIACYATGTSVLQSAFQHGGALTAAGIATLTTNAVPIAAGLVLFREPLPSGTSETLRIAAFACLVLGAAALADPRAKSKATTDPAAPKQKRAAGPGGARDREPGPALD